MSFENMIHHPVGRDRSTRFRRRRRLKDSVSVLGRKGDKRTPATGFAPEALGRNTVVTSTLKGANERY
jgi:hypothetical protein